MALIVKQGLIISKRRGWTGMWSAAGWHEYCGGAAARQTKIAGMERVKLEVSLLNRPVVLDSAQLCWCL